MRIIEYTPTGLRVVEAAHFVHDEVSDCWRYSILSVLEEHPGSRRDSIRLAKEMVEAGSAMKHDDNAGIQHALENNST